MSLLWRTAVATDVEIRHEDHGPFVDFMNPGGGRLTAHVPGEERPVAYLNYMHASPEHVGVDMLHTRPVYRRQGIGSSLMDRLREIHPGKALVTEDLSDLGRKWNTRYTQTRGVGIHDLHPGEWWDGTEDWEDEGS